MDEKGLRDTVPFEFWKWYIIEIVTLVAVLYMIALREWVFALVWGIQLVGVGLLIRNESRKRARNE